VCVLLGYGGYSTKAKEFFISLQKPSNSYLIFLDIKLGSDIKTDIIRDYIHYLKNEKGIWDNHQWLAEKYAHKKGLSPVTINIRLRTLKCFLKFLYDERYVPDNPGDSFALSNNNTCYVEGQRL
jgi:site-specific recombinase XerD